MSELSKEVEAIIQNNTDGFAISSSLQQSNMRSALRSVLLLAAKRLCLNCIYGIPLTKKLDGHVLGGEKLKCSAAPIHKMIRGEK